VQAAAGSGVSIRSTITNFFLDHQHHRQQQEQHGSSGGGGGVALRQQQQQVHPKVVLRTVPRLWTGFSATLVRDVPFSALYWAMVEPLRQAMLPKNSHWNPWPHQQQEHQLSGVRSSSSSSGSSGMVPGRPVHHSQVEILIANMVSGFVSGGLAAGITTPFDVVKTRMQIASPGSSSSSGGGGQVFGILRDVYARDGIEGLFSGVKPRAYRAAPACAIVISVYELLKNWLTAEW
jgi:solute carrier family 25 protein 39/40